MIFVEIFLIAFALSIDSMVASCACCAAHSPFDSQKRNSNSLLLAFSFALFQAGMLLVGWGVGTMGGHLLWFQQIDHWIAFALLALVSGKMIQSGFVAEESDEPAVCQRLTLKKIAILSIATSIDAAAVGLNLSISPHPILLAAAVVALVTFALSLLSGVLGEKMGALVGRWSEPIGGLMLLLIGVKILHSHLVM